MEKELILCDTNIFIAWFRGDLETRSRLEHLGLEHILIPSVTFMELLQGTRNKTESLQLKKKLKAYHIIHFNEITSRLAVRIEISNFTFSNIYRNFVVNNGHEKIIFPCFCSAFLRDPESPGAASGRALYLS